MVRKLKNAVGTCKVCGSSAVYKEKRIDGSLCYMVNCCNPDCGKHASFHLNKAHSSFAF